MFIAILTYRKPLKEVDRFLQAHRDYLAEHYAAGDFIASGPQNPRIGGVIMIKADNRADVDAIILKIRLILTESLIIRSWSSTRQCSVMLFFQISYYNLVIYGKIRRCC